MKNFSCTSPWLISRYVQFFSVQHPLFAYHMGWFLSISGWCVCPRHTQLMSLFWAYLRDLVIIFSVLLRYIFDLFLISWGSHRLSSLCMVRYMLSAILVVRGYL